MVVLVWSLLGTENKLVMHIIGGTYREIVHDVGFDSLWGSGFRAAASLSYIANVKFYTCIDSRTESIFKMCLKPFSTIECEIEGSGSTPIFEYETSVSAPSVRYGNCSAKTITVDTKDPVLCFGMIEQRAVVHGNRVVYDPQNPLTPDEFFSNGSTANELSIVLNQREAQSLFGENYSIQIKAYIAEHLNVRSVIVKRGPFGAFVFEPDDKMTTIPVFRTSEVFALGTGDIFSAFFTYFWAEQNESPSKAAELASRAVAIYVQRRGGICQITRKDIDDTDMMPITHKSTHKHMVYLAGPFFTQFEKHTLGMFKQALDILGVDYFSPLDDVGVGSSNEVCAGDLAGLERSTSVLANICGMDIGSIFEIGYARAKGIPVVAFGQNCRCSDLTMIDGSGCVITSDFSTAIYQAVWASIENA